MTGTNQPQENSLPRFEGVKVYTIEPNGCLNGIYTNNSPETGQRICNEIARKIPDSSNDPALEGSYSCCRIDVHNQQHLGILHIHRLLNAYALSWEENNKIAFTGTGYRTRPDQLVVVYTHAPTP